jgi:hypothetical protein
MRKISARRGRCPNVVNNPLIVQVYLVKSLDDEARQCRPRANTDEFSLAVGAGCGLRNIFITASRTRLLFFPTERVGGEREDRDQTQHRIGLDPARRLVTVHDKAI